MKSNSFYCNNNNTCSNSNSNGNGNGNDNDNDNDNDKNNNNNKLEKISHFLRNFTISLLLFLFQNDRCQSALTLLAAHLSPKLVPSLRFEMYRCKN